MQRKVVKKSRMPAEWEPWHDALHYFELLLDLHTVCALIHDKLQTETDG